MNGQMSINPSIQKLAELMQARQEYGEPPYVLLLGSSLSLTPAVRRAFAGTEDWEAFWGEMQCRAPMERKALLKKSLDVLGLDPGYQAVARLAEAGYFNIILTLNVDDALDNALRDLKTLPASEYRIWVHGEVISQEIVTKLDRPMPRIKVVKLRGDINAHKLPLTPQAQFEFPPDLERAVTQCLSRDTIVVGELPFDDDMQRCLRSGDGALWCILPDEPASEGFIMRVKQSRLYGEIITGVDAEFNKFFTALAVALEKDIVHVTPAVEPMPGIVRQPRCIDTRQPDRATFFSSLVQRMGAIWARYKTIIAILAVLLLMLPGITVLGKRIVSVWQPTPAPPTPQVSIEAFLITEGENPTVTVKPGTMIIATVQEIVQIKVEVSTTYEEQEQDLVFTWYTCREGGTPVDQSIGNPEMLYVAPGEPGQDCICVVIEKGGVLLDKSEIFVDLQK